MTSPVVQVLIDKINEYVNDWFIKFSVTIPYQTNLRRILSPSTIQLQKASEAMGKISGLTAEINGVLSDNPTGQQAWVKLLKIIGVGKLNLEESRKFKKQIPGWINKYLKPL